MAKITIDLLSDFDSATMLVERAMGLLRETPGSKRTFTCSITEGGVFEMDCPLTPEQESEFFFGKKTDERPELTKKPTKKPARRTDSARRNQLIQDIKAASSPNAAVDVIVKAFGIISETEVTAVRVAFVDTMKAVSEGKDRVFYNQIPNPVKDRLGKVFSEVFPANGKKHFNAAMWEMAKVCVEAHPEAVSTDQVGTEQAPPPNGAK